MCFSAIETLSREISRHSAARNIEGWDFSTAVEMTIGRVALVPLEDWDFSTPLRCGRNDDKGVRRIVISEDTG